MNPHSPRKRIWLWLAVALAVSGAALFAWLLPPDRSLLRVATPLLPGMRFWGGDYCWLTNDRLVFAAADRFHLFDLRSHKDTVLDVPLTPGWTHSALQASPNGEWITWEERPMRQMSNQMVTEIHECLVNLRFPQNVLHISSTGGIWSPDSKRLLCYQAESGNWGKMVEYEPKPGATTDLGHLKAYSSHYLDSSQLAHYVWISPNRVRGCGSVEYVANNEAPLEFPICEYEISPTFRRVSQIHLTQTGIYEMEVSPDGTRIAFLADREQATSFQWLLQRLPTQWKQAPVAIEELNVAGLDGRSSKTICWTPAGEVRSSMPVPLRDLHWLPDGKALSFLHKGALYTIPVLQQAR